MDTNKTKNILQDSWPGRKVSLRLLLKLLHEMPLIGQAWIPWPTTSESEGKPRARWLAPFGKNVHCVAKGHENFDWPPPQPHAWDRRSTIYPKERFSSKQLKRKKINTMCNRDFEEITYHLWASVSSIQNEGGDGTQIIRLFWGLTHRITTMFLLSYHFSYLCISILFSFLK